MNRKFLESLLSAIEDDAEKKEIIDKIMEKNGESIETQKKKLAVAENDLKVKEGVIEDLNKKIKENADLDLDAIKQEEFEKGKAEGSKEVETFKKSIALEKALAGTKAKDVKLLEKLLDGDKLKYDEEEDGFKVSGLDEQIKSIKETHGYLFEEEKQEEKEVTTGQSHNEEDDVDDAFINSVMGLETK